MSRSLPGLIDFYEEHEDQKEAFELIAFHTSSLKTLAAVDEKMAVIKERESIQPRWRGRDIPFPLLLDEGGETAKAYGVRALPTTVLIDPEGRLVMGAIGGDSVEKALEQELEELRGASVIRCD